MKKQRIRFLTTLAFSALVISAPVSVAAILINAASGAAQPVSLGLPSVAPPDSAASRAVPVVAGVLYTNGPVKVDWNGVNIPVQNSSYAYTGGELITTPPNGMGILRLGNGGTVFVCPGSKIRLSRTPAGDFTVDVAEGKSRFLFPAETPFRVRVNDTILTPDTSAPPLGESAQPAIFAGEVESTKNGGCLLCGLQNNLNVAGPGAASASGALSALAGQIVTVPGTPKPGAAAAASNAAGGGQKVSVLDMPQNVRSTLQAGLDAAGRSAGFLCKCRELREYTVKVAELMARQQAEDTADSERTEAEIALAASGDPELLPPDAAPPVAPPTIPGFELADSGAPDFLPGLVPAAGPGSAGELPGSAGEPPALPDTPIIVPPPFVPGSGAGGGGVVSPS